MKKRALSKERKKKTLARSLARLTELLFVFGSSLPLAKAFLRPPPPYLPFPSFPFSSLHQLKHHARSHLSPHWPGRYVKNVAEEDAREREKKRKNRNASENDARRQKTLRLPLHSRRALLSFLGLFRLVLGVEA